ncbi:MAG: M50 family metallopeptidase [Erysipelotrichaceae bacterium]|nr:M50 family metallopeptidase [Erysipelotrichaceae bacterium]
MTIIYFILMLSAIILIHEFGHFLMAKLFHVYVYEFALGMGPQLLKWQGKETVYSIRLFPIGGFVSLAGDEHEESTEGIPQHRLMPYLANWKKLCVFLAGPFMNFILAWVIFVGIYMHIGYVVDPPLPIVNGVIENSVAEQAGFHYGDEIIKLTFSDGSSIEPKSFYDILEFMQLYHDETTYTISRGDEVIELVVAPEYNEEEKRYMIGILLPETHARQLNFYEMIQEGNRYFWDSTDMMIKTLQRIVRGIGVDSLSGPVGIYTMTEQQVSYGFESFMALVGLLSLNVGFMNLIPIPMFDGGRILITLVEMLTRKKLPEKIEYALMMGSLVLLFGLFIFVTLNDITRIIG